tara:strand:- start:190 stop:471 length:282 start_codon:yes stop_codon:yes gene_type:complete
MIFDFEYYLPSGQAVLVEAKVTEGMRGMAQTTEFAGEPDEDPEIELSSITIEGEDVDLDDFWFRKFRSTEMINVIEDMKDKAWFKYMDHKYAI